MARLEIWLAQGAVGARSIPGIKKKVYTQEILPASKCLSENKFSELIRVQLRWHSLWVPVGIGCHGGRQAPPIPQPAGRWRRGASVPTEVLGQQQAGFSISRHKEQRQKCCRAAIQCGHVSHAPEPKSSAGLARKAPLPACVLNCMPLADIS